MRENKNNLKFSKRLRVMLLTELHKNILTFKSWWALAEQNKKTHPEWCPSRGILISHPVYEVGWYPKIKSHLNDTFY